MNDFASRVAPDRGVDPSPTRSRRELQDLLATRVYIDEPARLVSNGLSTEIMCFPSDVHPQNAHLLQEKIRSAMEYATTYRDIGALNALLRIPAIEPNLYLPLGLYLYLADECSRRGLEKTFLTAAREVGAEREPETPKFIHVHHRKVGEALKLLGMDESHGHILDEWFDKGTFTVNGEVNGVDTNGDLVGTYARLASMITHTQPILGMNPCISYALANRTAIEGKSPEFVHQHAKNMLEAGTPRIMELIEQGNQIREARIREKVQETFLEPPTRAPASTPGFIRKVLDYMPDAALEMFYRCGYTVAYADHENISTVYPAEIVPDKTPIPGISRESYEVTRVSKAARQLRYRTFFLSNGDRENAHDIKEDPNLRSQVLAQSMLHETMHMFYSYLGGDEKKELDALLERVQETLAAQTLPESYTTKLKTMDYNTLSEVLDYTSKIYPNYRTPNDSRREEVLCNVYGMMHTEHASPDSPLRKPPPGLECVKELVDAIDRATHTSLANCRKELPQPFPERIEREMSQRA